LTFDSDEARRHYVAFGVLPGAPEGENGDSVYLFGGDDQQPIFTGDTTTPVDEDFIDEYEDYYCLCGVHAIWEHDITFNFLSNDDVHVYPAGPQHGEHAYIATGKRRCDDEKCGCTTNEKCIHRGKDLKCDVCGKPGHDKHSCWRDKPYLDERVIKPNRVLTKAPKDAKTLHRDARGFKGLKPSRSKGKGKGKGTGRAGATPRPDF
jgi:hypothetical protein